MCGGSRLGNKGYKFIINRSSNKDFLIDISFNQLFLEMLMMPIF